LPAKEGSYSQQEATRRSSKEDCEKPSIEHGDVNGLHGSNSLSGRHASQTPHDEARKCEEDSSHEPATKRCEERQNEGRILHLCANAPHSHLHSLVSAGQLISGIFKPSGHSRRSYVTEDNLADVGLEHWKVSSPSIVSKSRPIRQEAEEIWNDWRKKIQRCCRT